MARSRNVKPGIMENEKLADLSYSHRLLFIYLWMLADKEGRLEDRPKRIKIQAFPYDTDLNIESMLNDLARAGFILRYSAGDQQVIQVINFLKHQAPHVREKPSDLPSPEQGTAKVVPSTEQGSASASPRSPDSLIPDLLIPDSLIPDVLNPDSETLPVAKAPAPTNIQVLKPKQKTDAQIANTNTWDAYTIAYLERYGVEPVRNAKVNAQVAQLVQRLGAEEAPQVAMFYVTINDSFFIRNSHELGLLVSRAEGIRTQWLTGRQVNAVTARQMENTQANITAAQEASRSILEGGEPNAFLRRNR